MHVTGHWRRQYFENTGRDMGQNIFDIIKHAILANQQASGYLSAVYDNTPDMGVWEQKNRLSISFWLLPPDWGHIFSQHRA